MKSKILQFCNLNYFKTFTKPKNDQFFYSRFLLRLHHMQASSSRKCAKRRPTTTCPRHRPTCAAATDRSRHRPTAAASARSYRGRRCAAVRTEASCPGRASGELLTTLALLLLTCNHCILSLKGNMCLSLSFLVSFLDFYVSFHLV